MGLLAEILNGTELDSTELDSTNGRSCCRTLTQGHSKGTLKVAACFAPLRSECLDSSWGPVEGPPEFLRSLNQPSKHLLSAVVMNLGFNNVTNSGIAIRKPAESLETDLLNGNVRELDKLPAVCGNPISS